MFRRYELVVDEPLSPSTRLVRVDARDKEVVALLQARWWAARGVRLRQDEVVAWLVADALESPSSRFAELGVRRSRQG